MSETVSYRGLAPATFGGAATFAIPAARVGLPVMAAASPAVLAALGGVAAGAAAALAWGYIRDKYLYPYDPALDASVDLDLLAWEINAMPFWTFNPLAGWTETCSVSGTVTHWKYGDGLYCGLTGFWPPGVEPGGGNTNQLIGWNRSAFPTFGTYDWRAIKNYSRSSASASVPPEGYQPQAPYTLAYGDAFSADRFRMSENVDDRRTAIAQLFSDWQAERLQWWETLDYEIRDLPYRDEATKHWPVTSEATSRGYAPPAAEAAPVEYRPDAYAANPGKTFGWSYAPSRPSAPAIPVPVPVVRPVPVVVTPGTVTQTETVVANPAVPGAPWLVPPGLFPSRPGKRTKERKGQMTIQGAAASVPGGTQGLRLFNMATEFCDAVEALWDAIPFDVKLKRGFVKKLPKSAKKQEGRGVSNLDSKNWSKPGCLRMAAQLNEAWKEMHLPTAVKNLIMEHLEDRAIGGLAQKASKAHASVQRRLRSRGASPLLGPTL